MKNKKSLLVLAIFALVLVLGVGYAAVSAVELTVEGTAAVKTEDLKVKFDDTVTPSVTKDQGVTAEASGTITGPLAATIAVSNLKLNESVTVTYTIANEETDINALVKELSITNDQTKYFEVTTDVKGDENAKTVEAGKTNTVDVTVKLIQTPVDSANSTANITVKFTATPVEAK